MFESKVLWKQLTVLKEVFVTLLGIFGDPQSFGVPVVIRRPGNCSPLAPARYTLAWYGSFVTYR